MYSFTKFHAWSLLLLALLPCIALATDGLNANSFIDPKDDNSNPLRYIPSNTLTGIALGLIVLAAVIEWCNFWKWGGKFMLAMLIGELTYASGIALRFGLHTKPDSQGLYIAEYMFITLSPCAFIASDYMILSRLSRQLGHEKHLLIRPTRLTKLFIASDIFTFLVQAAGGGIAASAKSGSSGQAGSHIFLGGLIAQLISFFTFTCVYLVFLYRVRTRNPETWTVEQTMPWYRDRRTLAGALIVSCIGILIRSVYRVIELSQGFEGQLATTEWVFYAFDTLPLFIAIAIYVPFWPGRFISGIPYSGIPLAQGTEFQDRRSRRGTRGSLNIPPTYP